MCSFNLDSYTCNIQNRDDGTKDNMCGMFWEYLEEFQCNF